jgi:hypothetical protein
MKSKFDASDAESILMSNFSQDLKQAYQRKESIWEDSPFAWIKTRPSRQIGAIGERLVSDWCQSKNFRVSRTGDSDADRMINGFRVEIKFSTLWTENGIYKFQQIRDQNYEYCLCLGVSPFQVHAWFIPKAEITRPRPPALTHQHGGKSGRDTLWLSFEANSPPQWLDEFGGTLGEVEKLIRAASKNGVVPR